MKHFSRGLSWSKTSFFWRVLIIFEVVVALHFFIFKPIMHYRDLHHFYSLMSVMINVMMCFYWAPIGLWFCKNRRFYFFVKCSCHSSYKSKTLNKFQFEFNYVVLAWNLIFTAKFSVIHAQNLWPHIACITVLECVFHKQLSGETIYAWFIWSARFTFALQFLALECVFVATLTKSITFTYSRDPNT